MRITRVEIDNFRSIEHLKIDTDRPLVVLEGPNDSGKSNIVQAIDLALRHASCELGVRAGTKLDLLSMWPPDFRQQNVLRYGATRASVELNVSWSKEQARAIGPGAPRGLDLTVEWLAREGGHVAPQVTSSDRNVVAVLKDRADPGILSLVGQLARLLGWGLRHVGTQRSLALEMLLTDNNGPKSIEWSGRNLKNILVRYKNSDVEGVQARFEELRRQLADPTLPVGELFVGLRGNAVFASTRHNGLTLDIEDRAAGIQQLIFILSLALCHEGSVVMLEEPELNLAKPLQRHLWAKLKELTGPGRPLDQIFITSHSELFEAEAERVIVTRPAGGWTTAVTAAPPPMKNEEVGVRPLLVTRDGALELDADARGRLQVQSGGHVYLKDTESGLSLLSAEEFARLLSTEDA